MRVEAKSGARARAPPRVLADPAPRPPSLLRSFCSAGVRAKLRVGQASLPISPTVVPRRPSGRSPIILHISRALISTQSYWSADGRQHRRDIRAWRPRGPHVSTAHAHGGCGLAEGRRFAAANQRPPPCLPACRRTCPTCPTCRPRPFPLWRAWHCGACWAPTAARECAGPERRKCSLP